jgi:hypothetical protein
MTKGIVCYGVPVGDADFVESFLIKKANRIVGDLATIGQRMSPQIISAPELPSRQCLWQLILRCLQHKGNYWCRHLPPDITKDFSRKIDLQIKQLVFLATDINTIVEATSDFTKERCRLPIARKGLGIRELEDRRYAEFIGGAVQGISRLMDRKNDMDGAMVKGRIQSPSLKAWIGESSFDIDNTNPWRVLMSKDSRIGTSLHKTWTHMSQDFRATCVRAGLPGHQWQALLTRPWS